MPKGVMGCAWLRSELSYPVSSVKFSKFPANELYDSILKHVTAAFFEVFLTCILFMYLPIPFIGL